MKYFITIQYYLKKYTFSSNFKQMKSGFVYNEGLLKANQCI